MPTIKNARPALLMLAAALLTTACATPSGTLPVVVSGPDLTQLPAEVKEIDPPPSGYYSKKLTDWRESSLQRLSSTPAK